MRNTTKKRHVWLTFFIILVLLHLCAFAVHLRTRNAEMLTYTQETSIFMDHPGKTGTWQAPSLRSNSAPVRLIYPRSVIRGGVRNVEELRTAMLKDSVVSAHFFDFNVAKSVVVDLKMEKAAYVSYRIDDKVYWTRKKVRLAKGEKLITDGVNYARARCGNRISDVPKMQTRIDEPPQVLLDTPVPVEESNALLLAPIPGPVSLPLENTPPAAFGFIAPSSSHPPGFLIPGLIAGVPVAGVLVHSGSGGGSDVPIPTAFADGTPTPTADVPEPSTLVFLTSGVACCLAFRRKLKK